MSTYSHAGTRHGQTTHHTGRKPVSAKRSAGYLLELKADRERYIERLNIALEQNDREEIVTLTRWLDGVNKAVEQHEDTVREAKSGQVRRSSEKRIMNCKECGSSERLIIKKWGLCINCYQRERLKNPDNRKSVRQKTKRAREMGHRRDKHIDAERRQETRDLLSAFMDAQQVLKQIALQEPETDYSAVLRQCEERIEALKKPVWVTF